MGDDLRMLRHVSRRMFVAELELPEAKDRVETIPREKTKDPTPTSICRGQHPYSDGGTLSAEKMSIRTRLVPKSSHFPCHLGNTGKSTARIQWMVMIII
jgi:hypothetical protein